MSNLRQVKKNIRNLCGDIASECVIASSFYPSVDDAKLADVVYGAAALQTKSIRKLSVCFDKTPRDFENKAAYNKARRKYYREAIAALDSLFFKEAEGLVAQLNDSVKGGAKGTESPASEEKKA